MTWLPLLIMCFSTALADGRKVQGRIMQEDDHYSEISLVGEGEHPYLAAILFMERHMCSGALIHPQWVLTTATCFNDLRNNTRVYVQLGSHGFVEDFILEERVTRIARHPNSPLVGALAGPGGRGPRCDAALLAFQRPTIINMLIQPIRMSVPSADLSGYTASVLGWRTLPFPRYLAVARRSDYTVFPKSACSSGTTAAKAGNTPPDICLSRQGKKFAGTHQPGSPVVVYSMVEDALYLAAVLIGDTDPQRTQLRATSVAHMAAWIQDVLHNRGSRALEWSAPS